MAMVVTYFYQMPLEKNYFKLSSSSGDLLVVRVFMVRNWYCRDNFSVR